MNLRPITSLSDMLQIFSQIKMFGTLHVLRDETELEMYCIPFDIDIANFIIRLKVIDIKF